MLVTPLSLSYLSSDICEVDCENTDLNKVGCNDEKVALPTGLEVRPSDICNDVCDEPEHCEDEATCNGFLYGKYCMVGNKLKYRSPNTLCTGWYRVCDDGTDEENCNVTDSTKNFCRHIFLQNIVPVFNYTRCGPISISDYKYRSRAQLYCVLDDVASFQTNCSDPSRVAVTCEMNGYISTVSKYMICLTTQSVFVKII